MKLVPFISNNSVYSRREAEVLVKQKAVKVNGDLPIMNQEIKDSDVVSVKGKVIKQTETVTLLVYKPKGYISTTKDPEGRKTVLDLVPKQKVRLYPVGRLDVDSRGLMILTNDGKLTHSYTHPSHEISKTYIVQLDHPIKKTDIEKLVSGIRLKEGIAKADSVKKISSHSIEMTLHEGKNREIRRMLGKIGFTVLDLERISIGKYTLDDLEGKTWKKVI